jgi:hypothetical protein
VCLDELEGRLDRELVAGIERAVDALADEEVVPPERGRALRFGDVLDEHDDVHEILPLAGPEDTRGDDGADDLVAF